MKKTEIKEFALCLNNEGYQASLETGKVYQIVPDTAAAAEGYIRVIDESGEDYAFAANRFFIIELPTSVQKELIPRLEFA